MECASIDVSGAEVENVNEFGFIDFMDESNFEQFMELIRGETVEPAVKFCPNYDCEHIIGSCLDDQSNSSQINVEGGEVLQLPTPGWSLDIHLSEYLNVFPTPNFDSLPLPNEAMELDMKLVNDDEEINEGVDQSSDTTTATQEESKRFTKKPDRSRTLISERKRRGRMKEKLYALRSLVPYITKMDKASIIGDAVLYLQELQMQAKKLRAEISSLESSLSSTPPILSDQHFHGAAGRSLQSINNTKLPNPPLIKRISQMEMFELEEREFYGRVVCNKGPGVAALLYKAIESFTTFKLRISNLAASSDNYVLTFTLSGVEEFDRNILNLPNLKLWIASAFLDQGFDFVTFSSA